MFLFNTLPVTSILMWFAVLGGLMLLNELARTSKWLSLALFLVLPAILTVTVWPRTAGPESSVGTWFHWAKVYSALAGCLGFLAIRYVKGAADKTWVLVFPPAILALNILEAVVRDFQISGVNGFMDGMLLVGGPWNVMNGIAGILNIVTISGWAGIYVSQKGKKKDMVWPDMLWFWVIAYDLWNFAYVYNCVPDHSFYAGAALLVSATLPAFFIKKGAWLQHRAQTLGFWMMFVMTVPSFVDTSAFAVKSSHSVAALWVVSGLSLAANVGVAVYHFAKVLRKKKNVLTDDIHDDLVAYGALKEA